MGRSATAGVILSAAAAALLILLASSISHAGSCSCTPPSDSCPSACATCGLVLRYCSCWTGCTSGGCPSGYTEIDSQWCGVFFDEHCQRGVFVGSSQCASCVPNRYGPTCAPCPGGVSNPCNGNGLCNSGISGNGICTCNGINYAGAACQFSRELTCSGHGFPQFTGSCACDVGFGGPACNQCLPNYYDYPSCTFCSAPITCSGQGVCASDGSCACNAGYAGLDCTDCQPGRFGVTCANECPGGAANPCNGNGACSEGTIGTGECSCNAGFVEPDCQSICGDVDDNALVDFADLQLYREHLADPIAIPLSPAGLSKCSVIGDAGPCEIVDVAVLWRSLESPPLAPGREHVCSAVVGP